MTQELYQKAMKFAGEKHAGQKVPGSEANYLLHISNVAMEIFMAYVHEKNFNLDFAVQVAALHDTIEDTDVTFEDIKTLFGEEIAHAVSALTKDKSIKDKIEKSIDSLNRINKLQKEVGMVKIADRITNLQPPPAHWSNEKIRKYLEEAEIISKYLKGKNEYLNNRLDAKIEEYKQYFE